ncbi:winged helix DNA-binding domain-containing protein [Bailinhaonella thermotolerans]|uniref:Winged helix DNA-binding domain-containing protein n=2 Tax=Bailinhaonella thermotolerans TaxID=1070861 RepID=A0A3A4BTR0_9ACTN|nr:winged helix DNA-binding domain-containing protein [Bailinhaonella thermotolerans]
MRHFGISERQARTAVRHRLAVPGAATPGEVAESVLVLHATDPATVFLAVQARSGLSPAAVEDALYEERSLLRMLAMRRTMFAVPAGFAPVVEAGATRAIAAKERASLLKLLAEAEVAPDPEAWLAEVEDSVVAALTARGEATAAELGRDEPRLRQEVEYAPGKSYGRPQAITTRVLTVLAAAGRIARGRPLGGWTSTQYRWYPTGLAGEAEAWTTADAQAELARRWLEVFGPAPVADLKWWTGWTAAEVKKALARISPAEVDLGGVTGIALPGDLEPEPAPEPWAALLPALDPTVMGWQDRSWFLGEHAPALFDRSGNAGPTVWWDGRVVGGWAQRADGEIVYRLLEDVGDDAAKAIEARAADLAAWLGPMRVTPRFRTPLERELVA